MTFYVAKMTFCAPIITFYLTKASYYVATMYYTTLDVLHLSVIIYIFFFLFLTFKLTL